MPIYTYSCTACDQQIERRQSFSDPLLTTCEACGGALRKLLHPAGVIFKGSGFYNTDYKNKSAGSSTSAETGKDGAKDSGKKDGDAAAPKTDTAPAAATTNGTSSPSPTGSSSTTGATSPA